MSQMVCQTNGLSERELPPPMTTILDLSLVVAVLANRTYRAACREKWVDVWAVSIVRVEETKAR